MLNKVQGLALASAVLILASCQANNATKTEQATSTVTTRVPQAGEPLAQNEESHDANWYLKKIKELKSTEADAPALLSMYDKLVPELVKTGKKTEAVEYASIAVSIAERHFGPDNVHVIPQIIILQKAAASIPERKIVSQCIDRTIDLQSKASGKDSLPVMWLLDSYARSKSQACGDEIDPEKLKWLVRLREKFSSPGEVETIRDKNILANSLCHKGQFKESFKIYDDCVDSCRKSKPGLLSEILLGYSRALLKGKKGDKAIPLLKEAYELSGPESPKYSSILAPEIAHELGNALTERKRGNEAKKIYQQMADTLKKEGNPKSEFFQSQVRSISS